MIKLLTALAILQVLNVLLGSIDAIINDFKKFEWGVFIKGILKGAVIFAAAYAVYYIGQLCSGMVELGNIDFENITTVLVVAAIGKYLYEVIKKIGIYWGVQEKVTDELGLIYDEGEVIEPEESELLKEGE